MTRSDYGTCRTCGARLLWIRTTAGKSMPCDPDPVKYWDGTGAMLITVDGRAISCSTESKGIPAKGEGFVPHWATCPTASRHKR